MFSTHLVVYIFSLLCDWYFQIVLFAHPRGIDCVRACGCMFVYIKSLCQYVFVVCGVYARLILPEV